MPSALQSVKFIGPARAGTAIRCAFAVYFAEPLHGRESTLAAWSRFARSLPLGQGMHVDTDDGAPILGLPRAGSIRCVFENDVSANDLAALAAWSVDHLPLAWGTAGFVFVHESGRKTVAYDRIAAEAKRLWGVQLLDAGALQWDALDGLPGINWLTLVGNAFAQARGVEPAALLGAASARVDAGVYSRAGKLAMVFAAGSAPTRGDVNVGDDLGPYAQVAELLEPLLVRQPTPLSGAFESPAVLSAWLRRFTAPRAWVECKLDAGD